MKNILKICVIAVLTLSMLLCIVACGDKDDTKDPATTTAKPATTTAGGGDDVTEAPVTTDAPEVEIGTDGNEFGGWNPIA